MTPESIWHVWITACVYYYFGLTNIQTKQTNSEGGRTTPSVVAFTTDDDTLIGQPAKRQAVTNPQNTVFSAKRFMGRMYDEVGAEMSEMPYTFIKGKNGEVKISALDKEYAPPQISAMILQKLKQTAEEYLGEKVTV